MIFADIKKKHSSHAITADVSLADTAHAAEFFGADALVVTGIATGRPTNPDDLKEARQGSKAPLAIGSGITPDNLPVLFPHAEAFIIGSYLKEEGKWDNPIDNARVEEIIRAFRKQKAKTT
jgi:predicted TIM-barrel enzyme